MNLRNRYGDPDVVAQTYVKKALNWPAIRPDNSKALDSYAIFSTEYQFSVNNVDSGRVLEYSDNMKLLIRKLLFYLQEKWRNVVYELKDKKEAVKFQNLVNFFRKEAKKANDPIYGKEVMNLSSTVPKRLNEKVNKFRDRAGTLLQKLWSAIHLQKITQQLLNTNQNFVLL